jgi:Kae1-associated kinase Bud32
MDLIAKGAEANLYKEDGKLIKNRIQKKYRIKELDERLRKLRTRHEAKILEKAKEAGINVPNVLKVDERDNTIEMEYIEGKRMKEIFDEEDNKKIPELSHKIGEVIAHMHKHNIIHNDLTTSNILLKEDKVYFIDFGLGYVSTRLEDKAMDLVVFKKSLLASHTKNYHTIWKNILQGYNIDSQTAKQMKDIEKRVRYASS